MKVFIDCGCLMLQKSLEMFLSEFIASYDECDMVISDEEKDTPKPLFLVGDENGDGCPLDHVEKRISVFEGEGDQTE